MVAASGTPRRRPCWRRVPRSQTVTLNLPEPGAKPPTFNVPDSGGLKLLVTVRSAESAGLPAGSRAVSVFLVNSRRPDEVHPYRAFIFQVRLTLQCGGGFVARPDPRAWEEQDEWDQRVADLHYRDGYEFAVGHGVSVQVCQDDVAACHCVRTIWIPEAEVERVAAQKIPDVVLGMEALGQLTDGAGVRQKLGPLVRYYRVWIGQQRATIAGLGSTRATTAAEMLSDAETAAARIEAGIELLVANADVREAFALALLGGAQKAWARAGGKNLSPNSVEPYMTLLGYFSSLREVGGSRRIIEDEVRTRLAEYGRRRRLEPDDRLFADRHIDFEVLELTSRVRVCRLPCLVLPQRRGDQRDAAFPARTGPGVGGGCRRAQPTGTGRNDSAAGRRPDSANPDGTRRHCRAVRQAGQPTDHHIRAGGDGRSARRRCDHGRAGYLALQPQRTDSYRQRTEVDR